MTHAPDFTSDDAYDPRLYPRCIFCGGEFADNPLFGRVPPGSQLAYDPARGRLWSVCTRCRRWNLIPIEERFDAIDALERAVRDAAVPLAATAAVSLHRLGTLSILRVGPAPLVERVAWRYGGVLLARHAAFRRTTTRVGAATLGALAQLGESVGVWRLDRDWGPSAVADILRWRRFGFEAWSGRSPCPSCGSVLRVLRFDVSWWLHPRITEDRLVVGVPCTRCDPWTPEKVFDVAGDEALLLLRRVLAYQHVAGAGEREVRDAARLLSDSGSAEALVRRLATGRASLWRLGPVQTLALEIALNHVAERRQLELRLHGVEAEWRTEEALAAIVDGDLT
jgi:hypothetical protein